MDSDSLKLGRRAFAALAIAAVPAASVHVRGAEMRQAQFLRDLALSYEQQLIGVDMEDVDIVFRGLRAPVLGYGVASGLGRAAAAAEAAVRDAGRVGGHLLVVIAAAPGNWQYGEHKLAFNTVLDHATADEYAIYAPCEDPSVPAGQMRVSILTG